MLIGEVARLSGMSKDGIRHYEALGLIQSLPRQAGSKVYRDYDPSVLETIEQIRSARRHLGMSLKEIGPMLQTVASRTPSKQEVVEFLDERLALTRERIVKLREVENFIVAKIARYRQDITVSSRANRERPIDVGGRA